MARPYVVRLTLLAVLGAAVLWTGATRVSAQSAGREPTQRVGGVRAERYDVALEVQLGGDVVVRETQEIASRGGPFSKGTRRIALHRLEGVRDVRVEEAGQPYRPGRETPNTFAVSGPASRQGAGAAGGTGEVLVEWWFPPTSDSTRTFVLTYRAVGAVRYYPAGDQLRWQVLGADRPYPVARSAITLRLPADVPDGGWRLDAYPGRYAVPGGASAGGAAAAWQAGDLPPNQLFEIRAQWPHGLVPGSPPSWQAAADAEDWRDENLRPVLNLAFGAAGLLVPFFGGLAVLLNWYTRGRDPRVGAVPPELESPPSDLPPGVVGTVVDDRADVHDVIATVLDLAARGIITIREVRDPQLAGSQRDFELALVQPDVPGLRPYERAVLESFFSRGSPVRLSRLGDWFRESIPRIQQALHREAAAAGLFAADPEAVRRRYRRRGALLLVAGLGLGGVTCGAAAGYAAAIPWPFFGCALVGALVYWHAGTMPRRTAAGALAAARWRAYARHLARAQPQALAPVRNGPAAPEAAAERRGEVFERTLPYAVALGIDRTWVSKFASVGTPAPRWLRPPPVVVLGGPTWGGPWAGPLGPMGPMGPMGPGGWPGRPAARPPRGDGGAPGPPVAGPQGWSDSAAGGLEGASGALADLLNAASEVLSRGGGSGWSGGGSGGGFGGGGGAGSGGGGSGFE